MIGSVPRLPPPPINAAFDNVTVSFPDLPGRALAALHWPGQMLSIRFNIPLFIFFPPIDHLIFAADLSFNIQSLTLPTPRSVSECRHPDVVGQN
jgi:hypothetical protein